MQVALAWPDKALSPNYRSRSHWPRTNALKKAVAEGWGATMACRFVGAPAVPKGQRLSFVITAYPPDKRARDDDNLIASLKGHRDGIAKALGIDDKFFDQRLQWGEPVKGGKIVVTVG